MHNIELKFIFTLKKCRTTRPSQTPKLVMKGTQNNKCLEDVNEANQSLTKSQICFPLLRVSVNKLFMKVGAHTLS